METLDWEAECDRFRKPNLVYPDYYTSQNFHGIQGGYLNAIAAVTYDPVTALASPPSEIYIRHQLITAVETSRGELQKILDLGCGTGSSSILLKQAFPQAEVVGVDLSPYMLAIAQKRSQASGVRLRLQHSLAEATELEPERFDLVTASFLFHEMPPQASRQVLQEAQRLLRPGGQLLILDGSQSKLRRLPWLIDLFREPYSKVYAAEWIDDCLLQTGFVGISTRSVGWIQQISRAVKPWRSCRGAK